MRLWHYELIPYLPRQQLLGQWRECVLIAKNIAEKDTPNHVLVNRVMDYPMDHFQTYCYYVWDEMIKRKYRTSSSAMQKIWPGMFHYINYGHVFKGWHNDRYLKQCLANLQEKADCGAIPEEEWKRITDRWPEWR